MSGVAVITLCLYYDDVQSASDWLTRAFGFQERARRGTAGQVTHAETELAGLRVALEQRNPADTSVPPARIQLTTTELDLVHRRALDAGATVVEALTDSRAPGDRGFTVADPGGYHWTFVTQPAEPTGNDATAGAIGQLGQLTDLATPSAVRVLATLRVPDLIDKGVTELAAIADACDADRDALGRLLRYLVHQQLLTEPASDVFALTEIGRLLCEQGPAGQRAWLDLDGLGARMDLAYQGLLHSVRTGEPAYATVHGRTFWAELDAEPGYRRYFDELMMTQQHLTAPQVADLYDWSGVTRVYDVGGGSGALLTQLLHSHPHLLGTLVDRPSAARAAADRIAAIGLADRAETVTGDFFGPLPTGGDVYVVSRALTDWNDRDATTILRRCAEAAGARGRVLIVEVLPTEPYVPHLSPFDLQMLIVVGGRERGLADFEALAGRAGLAISQVVRGRDGLTLIECVAAPVSDDVPEATEVEPATTAGGPCASS